MKKNFKRVLSAALVVVMLFTAFPAAFAFGSKETDYTIISPYEQVDWSTWKTYKANLHAHCDASDGDPTLDEMVEEYYKADYDILAMTDHGVITNGWTSERETNGIFNKFRKVYPMSEENYERITKGLDRGGRGMTDIRGGIECNMAVISKTHVNGYFTTYGQGEWGIENDYRTAPVEIEKAGGYSVLNHVGDWVDSGRFPHRSHWNVYIAYFAGIFIDCPSCLGMEIVTTPTESPAATVSSGMSCFRSLSPRAEISGLLPMTIPKSSTRSADLSSSSSCPRTTKRMSKKR